MIIYIAGKMTGLPDLGRAAFFAKAAELEMKGHIVLNPAVFPTGMPKAAYMPICMAMIDAADAIYMLDGWYDSPGANIEWEYAKYQGKLIIGGDVQ